MQINIFVDLFSGIIKWSDFMNNNLWNTVCLCWEMAFKSWSIDLMRAKKESPSSESLLYSYVPSFTEK